MVQLERYGADKVALRVLKILEPLVQDHDDFLCRPTEGELIKRSSGVVVKRGLSVRDTLTLPMNFEDLP